MSQSIAGRLRTARVFAFAGALALSMLWPARLTAADDEFAPVREMLPTCFACHGESGARPLPQNPILAGQEYYYLYVQLKDFKSGLRKSEIMGPVVQALETEKLALLAKFFSLETWPAIGHAAHRASVDIATVAIDSGECISCHLGDFRGNSRVPRLAGQSPDYLNRTMLDFKNRVRNNAPAMNALMVTFSEKDIASLADYFGSLSVFQSSQTSELQ